MKPPPKKPLFSATAALLCALSASAGTPADAEPESVPAAVSSEEKIADGVPATESFPTARTEFFSVSAETSAAANAASELAREVEAYFLKTPRLWKNFLPETGTRADVELFSAPGIFRLRQGENGEITLCLSEEFSDEAGVRRMRARFAEALLARMFPAAAKSVPAWIVSAVATESELGNVRGRHFFLRKKSAGTPSVSPLALLSATSEDFLADETLLINALWFLRAQRSVAVFFDAGNDAETKLVEAFPRAFPEKKFDAGTAEKFWATRFRRLIDEAPAGIDLPQESRRAFDDALLFLVEKNGAETRVLADELVASRLNGEIRALAAARLAALAAHFRKVNPVWHNAFTEYGLFLEMFGDPDVPAETLAAQWNKTLFARDEALAVQRELREALGNADADGEP